jgi:hypothetical protein
MKKRFFASMLGAVALFFSSPAQAGDNGDNEDPMFRGKLELGPAYMHIDMLSDGVIRNKLDLYGMQANASVIVWKGATFKLGGIYGRNDGQVNSLSFAAGWTIPLEVYGWKFYITPNGGYTIGYLRGNTDLDARFIPLNGIRVKQAFHNKTPFVGIDITSVISEKWTTTTVIQYGWTRSKVTWDNPAVMGVSMIPANGQTTESRGFNLGSVVDYWVTENWSINLAVGTQHSRGKEKDATKAFGGRIGVGYYF